MKILVGSIGLAAALLLLSGGVSAQNVQEADPAAVPGEPDEVPPPPPAGDSSRATGTPSAPAASEGAGVVEATCQPACRSGFVCHGGQCISACNPPCGSGERCVDGDCQSSARATVPIYPAATDDEIAPEAEVRPAADGVEQHDGFMLRLALGLGTGSSSEEAEGTEITMSGLSGTFSIDLGASVAEDLVIHARLSDFVLVDPTVSINDRELGTAEDTSVTFILLAPALTYYFMPVNVYVTVAGGVAWGSAEVRGQELDTGAGFGLNVDVGKEWWVGDDWGLGLAARFWYSQVPDEVMGTSTTLDLNFLAFGVMFSATYQ